YPAARRRGRGTQTRGAVLLLGEGQVNRPAVMPPKRGACIRGWRGAGLPGEAPAQAPAGTPLTPAARLLRPYLRPLCLGAAPGPPQQGLWGQRNAGNTPARGRGPRPPVTPAPAGPAGGPPRRPPRAGAAGSPQIDAHVVVITQ